MDKTNFVDSKSQTTTDISKVRSGAITKKVRPKPNINGIALLKESLGFVPGYQSAGERALGLSPRVLRAIDRERRRSELENPEEKPETDHDEGSDLGEGDEDEEVPEERDAGWEEEWEENGEDITCVRVPEPGGFNSYLELQDAYIVTSEYEHNHPSEVKINEIHGVYSQMPDANRAAQEHAHQKSCMRRGNRYKEHVYCDGTFHARHRSELGELLSVDVEWKPYTLRVET